jgi:hypothetical protein
MIIIFTSNWIFLRARAHMPARKCALRTHAHSARTRVRLYQNINKILYFIKGEKKKLTPQIGHLEKRSKNGWKKRKVTLVVPHKARP